MNLQQKQKQVEALTEKFAGSAAVYFVDYKGCKCESLTTLRNTLRKDDSGFAIIKNTLALRSLNDTLVNDLDSVLKGPTAVIWSAKDPIGPAKAIADFAKINENFKIKGGVVDGSVVASTQVESLASMPSKEELLSKLLALINAPATQLLRTINAPASQIVQLLEAWRSKKEKG